MKNTRNKSKTCNQNDYKVNVPRSYAWDVLSNLHDDLCQYIKSEENISLKALIRRRNFSELMDFFDGWGLQCMSSSDVSLAEVRAKHQLASLLKKLPLDSGLDTKSAALDKFHEAEAVCRDYNLQGYKPLISGEDELLTHVLTYARAFVLKVLSDTPPDWEELIWSRHGPGANLDTFDGQTSQYHKFANWPYSVTSRAFGHAVRAISLDERWRGALEDSFRQQFNIAPSLILNQRTFWHSVLMINDSNRITTVPKSYKTDRTIGIEPCMNLFLQLGVNGFIARRLLRWNINLSDQKKNQELARLGSIYGTLATLDLKAASDTISLRIVKELLPPKWYTLLLDLRAPYGDVDGQKVKFHKLSSMGNGCTFALETLIFSAAISGCLRAMNHNLDIRDCAVYGDDLIVPTDVAEKLIYVLNAFGFQLNLDKSFISGKFRESCGADWFDGRLVRPVFFDKIPKTITELFCDYNRLKRILEIYFGITSEESKTLKLLWKWIPQRFQTFTGPLSDEDFDSYIHSAKPCNTVWSNGMWKIKRVVPRVKKKKAKSFFFRKLMAYLLPTHGKGTSTSSGCVFDVAERNAQLLAENYSSVSHWQSEYACVPVTKKLKLNFL